MKRRKIFLAMLLLTIAVVSLPAAVFASDAASLPTSTFKITILKGDDPPRPPEPTPPKPFINEKKVLTSSNLPATGETATPSAAMTGWLCILFSASGYVFQRCHKKRERR
ncbi:MAG: hypothetical protein LKJ03_04725 [Enterococcaceae bacterium]|jgi:hypothetical protein|nr:hypothetical protein [Enterococcaceae bacterium]MCI1919882.1 hypothetical protein [Enterococcaceae bacterium]